MIILHYEDFWFQEGKPVYMAVKGVVFDVTSGKGLLYYCGLIIIYCTLGSVAPYQTVEFSISCLMAVRYQGLV